MSEWDSYASDWDDDPAARAYAAAAFASLATVLGDRGLTLHGTTVVDFGCGTGLLTERLVEQGATVLAIDTSTAMLDVVQRKIADRGWRTVTVAADVPDNVTPCQLVVCSSVCSFLDDYAATVATLAVLLEPGGLFVQWDWERDDTDEDPHGLSRAEITDALQAAGLEHISVGVGFEAVFEAEVMRPLMGHGNKPDAR